MKRILVAIFVVALTTLVMELALTRAFDVILTTNMAYMVITCVLFSFGLAGIYMTLRPLELRTPEAVRAWLARESVIFGLLTALVLPVVNWIPFDYDRLPDEPFRQLALFAAIYLVLVGPFFIAGRILAGVFSTLPSRIQTLYFFDLAGAALGCVILIPFLPAIGPGGLLLCSAGLALAVAASLEVRRWRAMVWSAAALVLILLPVVRAPQYLDFTPKTSKRGVLRAVQEGRVELSVWDPVSKIDVVDLTEIDPATGEPKPYTNRMHVAYDGGSQSSHIYPFDGDFRRLRDNLETEMTEHFWNLGVLASHWVKRDSDQRVLVIGSAGGQETKAALLFGAERVDAIEMVGAVVDLGLNRYSEYNGGIFRHPAVHVRVGEGRSFLRASTDRYDIIQIYSNHTSSSIAAGTGAMSTAYLQTVEAYKEYFEHLADDGILHINHHIYPKLVATSARAWKELGRTDFRRHVVIFKRNNADNLPTMLTKMTPWTAPEIEELKRLFHARYEDEKRQYLLVENPLDPEASFLSAEFYSGELSRELLASVPYRLRPPTDDRPFFNFLRRSVRRLEPDATLFTNESAVSYLNSSLKGGKVPMDVGHLIATGVVSLFFALLFILLPLVLAPAGRTSWPYKASSLVYFACLGAGFIIVELVFIQIFMKLIGPPLHTVSTVLFTLLLAASLGSALSAKLNRFGENGWRLPFLGVLAIGVVLLLSYGPVFGIFLGHPIATRMAVAAVLIFPLGVCMGMPFPLGVLALEREARGAIAWAWGLNGLFTVIGGLMSVMLSLFLGFRVTLIVAFAIYAVAFLMYSRMRRALPEGSRA